MLDMPSFGVFLTAAVILSLTPGPGIMYVLTRSLAGGRRDGLLSTLGNTAGGMVHVVAAAFGLSAILAASATAFTVVKFAGAAYLIYLGVRTIWSRSEISALDLVAPAPKHDTFVQGILTEVLNPKTALFFLAFIPQFINPSGPVVAEFLLLGTLTVLLNTLSDLGVAWFAGPLGDLLRRRAVLRRAQRYVSGGVLVALGVYVALADERR